MRPVLLTAQQQQSELIERVRTLETEVANFETWETEKKKYRLEQLSAHGIYAYEIKEEARGSEPTHWVCPDCYQNRKKLYFNKLHVSRDAPT